MRQRGFSDLCNFYNFANYFSEETGFSNGWRLNDATDEEYVAIKWLAESFEERTSADHIQHFLYWRPLCRDEFLAGFESEVDYAYFPDFVVSVMTGRESFIDVGAHTDKVICCFQHRVDGKYNRVIGIESDSFILSMMVDFLGEADGSIRFIAAGTGAKRAFPTYAIGRIYLTFANDCSTFVVPGFAFAAIHMLELWRFSMPSLPSGSVK